VSLMKLIPPAIHGIADYSSALALIVVALVVDGSGAAVATGVGVGGVILVLSLLTRYPLGVVKTIPFKTHSIGDYAAAAALIAAPFVLGFNDSDKGLTTFYLVVGVALLGGSLITDYEGTAAHDPATGRSARA
jgi:hypothetical protein